ncbi:hypothetical protein [Haloglomus litoreum]|uniref:hypothetical protein n=1 Tax=Haloglomus litoreum TaxID=3034026 RepID=UPI0023E8B429|nr:hypothetical protein [Haloglomus sp. DT116]
MADVTAPLVRWVVVICLVAGVGSPAAAQSTTDSPTPCCDDDFGGNFGLSLILALGGGFLVFAIILLSLVEAVTPDVGAESQSGDE